MKIREGNIIKHREFKDVAVKVLEVAVNSSWYSIKGTWINLGQISSFPLHIETDLIIMRTNERDWSICLDPKADLLRDAKWEIIA